MKWNEIGKMLFKMFVNFFMMSWLNTDKKQGYVIVHVNRYKLWADEIIIHCGKIQFSRKLLLETMENISLAPFCFKETNSNFAGFSCWPYVIFGKRLDRNKVHGACADRQIAPMLHRNLLIPSATVSLNRKTTSNMANEGSVCLNSLSVMLM